MVELSLRGQNLGQVTFMGVLNQDAITLAETLDLLFSFLAFFP
jgi:hypothetical protein